MLGERIKTFLASTYIGPIAIRLRQMSHVLLTIVKEPEKTSTEIHDYVAERLLVRLARPKTTFIDVGAHVGSVLGQVRAYDRSVALIGIEAVPHKAKTLKVRFPFAQIHNCAAGSSSGEVDFFVNTDESAYSSLTRVSGERIRVPMKRLDDLVSPSNLVDVLKLDVEGAELGVLQGAEGLIERCRPVIEFESAGIVGPNEQRLFEWFSWHAYSIFVPIRVAHEGPPLTGDGFSEAHFYPRRTTNYFAIPNERRVEFRDRARDILGIAA